MVAGAAGSARSETAGSARPLVTCWVCPLCRDGPMVAPTGPTGSSTTRGGSRQTAGSTSATGTPIACSRAAVRHPDTETASLATHVHRGGHAAVPEHRLHQLPGITELHPDVPQFLAVQVREAGVIEQLAHRVPEQKTLRLVAKYTDACNLFDIPDG